MKDEATRIALALVLMLIAMAVSVGFFTYRIGKQSADRWWKAHPQLKTPMHALLLRSATKHGQRWRLRLSDTGVWCASIDDVKDGEVEQSDATCQLELDHAVQLLTGETYKYQRIQKSEWIAEWNGGNEDNR